MGTCRDQFRPRTRRMNPPPSMLPGYAATCSNWRVDTGERGTLATNENRGDRFTLRHLVEMYSRGFITAVPTELGMIPHAEPDEKYLEDLVRWNVVNGATFTLTPEAQELFRGLITYEWAVWGVVLQYNESVKVSAAIPDELAQYGIQYAIRSVPRASYMLGVNGNKVTTAISGRGDIDISEDYARGSGNVPALAAKILMTILDPEQRFSPYPINPATVPHAVTRKLAGGRSTKPEDRLKELKKAQLSMAGAGMADSTTGVMTELLGLDNVSNAVVAMTRATPTGRAYAHNNATGVLFYLGKQDGETFPGAVVSYPKRGPDGRLWIRYEPADEASLARAIEAMYIGLESAPPNALITT